MVWLQGVHRYWFGLVYLFVSKCTVRNLGIGSPGDLPLVFSVIWLVVVAGFYIKIVGWLGLQLLVFARFDIHYRLASSIMRFCWPFNTYYKSASFIIPVIEKFSFSL